MASIGRSASVHGWSKRGTGLCKGGNERKNGIVQSCNSERWNKWRSRARTSTFFNYQMKATFDTIGCLMHKLIRVRVYSHCRIHNSVSKLLTVLAAFRLFGPFSLFFNLGRQEITLILNIAGSTIEYKLA